ncbi:MAG: hypothetical protein K2Y22_17195 [Candidatus Obscuribacterales bacterium]|nr:hypothetical protein [Candidatus Obscuribacterales bacterium]
MSEFNEFSQPSALAWKSEVSGSWLAYESQDTQRKLSTAAQKPEQALLQPDIDVASGRAGDTLNFSKDENGYFFFKVKGDDNYARHYFNKAQQWARLETLDKNGHRVVISYELATQRNKVDEWLATKKPVETPVKTQPSHLEVTPAFTNVEQQKSVGRPILPDQYHYLSNITDSMNFKIGKNPLGVLRMISDIADKVGNMTDDQLGAMHDYIEGTRNRDPKLRLQMAVAELARASQMILSKNENGELVFSVKDDSPAGAYINAAVAELDKAIQSSDSLKAYADYRRTNNKARNLRAAINFVKTSLDTGDLKVLNGRPLPELLP